MNEIEYAQEYLVLSIQCLERDKNNGVELVESYLNLADILRKQANVEQCIQAMLKSVEIEQEIPDRSLSLAESYK
jgi:urease gamma subunit